MSTAPPRPSTADGGPAEQLAGQAREQASEAVEQARGRARQEIDRRSTDAGERVRSQADDLRAVAEQLRERGDGSAADMAERVAERADRVGAWLRDADADQLRDDVEDVARRNPWPVFAGSIAAGFAVSRMLKVSSGERHRARTGTAEMPWAGTAEAPTGDMRSPGRFARPGESANPLPEPL